MTRISAHCYKGVIKSFFGLAFQAWIVFLMGTLLAGCSWLGTGQSKPKTPIVNSAKLPNGLNLYTFENHDVPLVTLDMWVRVGSKDEPAELAGISHFLEHMLFKGTPRLGVGEYDRRIEESGGYLNAATSSDYTHYYLIVPSEHLDRALTDMADVLLHSTIDPTEVEKERQVILEEIRQKQDNPIGFMYDEIIRRMYTSGPYANTVIGSSETVSAMTADQIREHHRRFYVPENMAFIAAGDFDRQKLTARLNELLGEFNRPLRPWREGVPETTFAAPEEKTWKRDWQQTYFFLTFPGDGTRELKQAAINDLTERILVGGRSSRLVNVLREKKKLVTSISGWGPTGLYPGFWAFYGTTSPENLDKVRQILFAELDKIIADGISGAEMRRAKRQIVTDHLYHIETNTGKASLIGYSHALFGGPELLDEYLEAVDQVTERDIIDTIKILAEDKASLYVAQPEREPAIP